MTYVCNDGEVAPQRQLSWSNGYLIFLHKTSSSDTRPAEEETDIEELDSSEEDIEEPAGDIDSEGNEEGMVQATECRTTSSRHDDWLQRGPFFLQICRGTRT